MTEYCRHSQVFINYGAHDNKTLLVEYGFVLPRNIHDVVPVDHMRVYSLITRGDNVLGTAKVAIIKQNGLDHDFSISESCGASWSLLVSLRILAMDEGELQSWQRALSGNISVKNEDQVREWTKSLVKNTLCSYRTTVEEDQSLIEQTVYSENKRLAVQFLLQEKLILQGTLNRLCQINSNFI